MTTPAASPLKANHVIGAIKFAAEKGLLDTDQALDQLTSLVEAAGAPGRKPLVSVKTEIGTKMDGTPLIVAWNVCYECKGHISHCDCSKGPKMPPYIGDWIEEERQRLGKVSTAVGSTPVSGNPLSPGEGSGSEGNPVSPIGTEGGAEPSVPVRLATGPTCETCKTSVSKENGDPNDDGTWTCFDCQAG